MGRFPAYGRVCAAIVGAPCFNRDMPWDPIAAAHLGKLTQQFEERGVVKQVRDAVSELWRANVERHDPDALFDDNGTLGFSASTNVANRVYFEMRSPNGVLLPGAVAQREKQSTVIRVDDLQARIVKVPVARGRKPHFTTDFSWEEREGRLAPAARNASFYEAPSVEEGHEPMFEIEIPDADQRIVNCKDLFFVWAGDMDGRTAGWTGLPTTGPKSFLAVQPIWYDEDLDSALAPTKPVGPAGGPTFSQIEPHQPQVTLKPKSDEGSANG